MIKRCINRFLKFIWIMNNSWEPSWLRARKRWYVFKNSPDLYVRYISTLRLTAKESSHTYDLALLAHEEVKTRRIRKKNDKTN